MDKYIAPPACLGIMGGGQLGRMFAISAKQMGYKVAVLESDPLCPAKQFADYHIVAKYDDQTALDELARLSDVITTEFENVPSTSLAYLNRSVPVFPSAASILVAQNRLDEKKFFNDHGIKTTKYCPILNLSDIDNVDPDMFPAILKTNTLGYDGKGQARVNNKKELLDVFEKLAKVPCILEKMVDLKLEISIMVSRNQIEMISYPVVENIHHNGILDITIAPARIDATLKNDITKAGLAIIKNLNYVGVLAIEFFISRDNKILANEMAPRPHNSGHYTIDSCITSQFEQQVRSMCNLKLGDSELKNNVIMLNLLGDIWVNETTHPDWGVLLAEYPNLKLHLYEKQIAKPGRKMGHLTIQGPKIDELIQQIKQIKIKLGIMY